MVPAPFHIRRCQPDDAEAVYEVCLRTGDNGHDATGLFDDPKALGHVFVGPYLKLEQDLAFVLEDPQGVCGYALGALDSRRYYEAYRTKWLPQLRSRFAEPTGDPARWTRTQQVYYEYYQAPQHRQPALHVPRAQGRGLGKELMRVLLDELAARGSPGVHLGLGATNARAERFYKRLGFHQLVRVGDVLYLGKQLP